MLNLWPGSKSRRSIEVAAVLFSLFESAKVCGVEPKVYVLKATTPRSPSPAPQPYATDLSADPTRATRRISAS